MCDRKQQINRSRLWLVCLLLALQGPLTCTSNFREVISAARWQLRSDFLDEYGKSCPLPSLASTLQPPHLTGAWAVGSTQTVITWLIASAGLLCKGHSQQEQQRGPSSAVGICQNWVKIIRDHWSNTYPWGSSGVVTWGDIRSNTSICPLEEADPYNRINSWSTASYSINRDHRLISARDLANCNNARIPGQGDRAPSSGSPAPLGAASHESQSDRSSPKPQNQMNPISFIISTWPRRNKIKISKAPKWRFLFKEGIL